MNKHELIYELKRLLAKPSEIKGSDYVYGHNYGIGRAISLVKQLDEQQAPINEPRKPVVPQFVADWYEEYKGYFEYNLHSLCVDFHERKLQEDLHEWFNALSNKPIETLVRMKLFGYEVEKGKLYTVEIPICNSPLGYHYVLRKTISGEIIIDSFFTNSWVNYDYCQLTESEIKKDHEWAWKYAKEVEE